jgi:hypothetical protein
MFMRAFDPFAVCYAGFYLKRRPVRAQCAGVAEEAE